MIFFKERSLMRRYLILTLLTLFIVSCAGAGGGGPMGDFMGGGGNATGDTIDINGGAEGPEGNGDDFYEDGGNSGGDGAMPPVSLPAPSNRNLAFACDGGSRCPIVGGDSNMAGHKVAVTQDAEVLGRLHEMNRTRLASLSKQPLSILNSLSNQDVSYQLSYWNNKDTKLSSNKKENPSSLYVASKWDWIRNAHAYQVNEHGEMEADGGMNCNLDDVWQAGDPICCHPQISCWDTDDAGNFEAFPLGMNDSEFEVFLTDGTNVLSESVQERPNTHILYFREEPKDFKDGFAITNNKVLRVAGEGLDDYKVYGDYKENYRKFDADGAVELASDVLGQTFSYRTPDEIRAYSYRTVEGNDVELVNDEIVFNGIERDITKLKRVGRKYSILYSEKFIRNEITDNILVIDIANNNFDQIEYIWPSQVNPNGIPQGRRRAQVVDDENIIREVSVTPLAFDFSHNYPITAMRIKYSDQSIVYKLKMGTRDIELFRNADTSLNLEDQDYNLIDLQVYRENISDDEPALALLLDKANNQVAYIEFTYRNNTPFEIRPLEWIALGENKSPTSMTLSGDKSTAFILNEGDETVTVLPLKRSNANQFYTIDQIRNNISEVSLLNYLNGRDIPLLPKNIAYNSDLNGNDRLLITSGGLKGALVIPVNSIAVPELPTEIIESEEEVNEDDYIPEENDGLPAEEETPDYPEEEYDYPEDIPNPSSIAPDSENDDSVVPQEAQEEENSNQDIPDRVDFGGLPGSNDNSETTVNSEGSNSVIEVSVNKNEALVIPDQSAKTIPLTRSSDANKTITPIPDIPDEIPLVEKKPLIQTTKTPQPLVKQTKVPQIDLDPEEINMVSVKKDRPLPSKNTIEDVDLKNNSQVLKDLPKVDKLSPSQTLPQVNKSLPKVDSDFSVSYTPPQVDQIEDFYLGD